MTQPFWSSRPCDVLAHAVEALGHPGGKALLEVIQTRPTAVIAALQRPAIRLNMLLFRQENPAGHRLPEDQLARRRNFGQQRAVADAGPASPDLASYFRLA